MPEKSSDMSADGISVASGQDLQIVPETVDVKGKPLNSVMDTSIDSGIHDIVIKQEPLVDDGTQDTMETVVENVVDAGIKVKTEPVSDSEIDADRGKEGSSDMQIESDTNKETVLEIVETSSKECEEKAEDVNLNVKEIELVREIRPETDLKPGMVEDTSDVSANSSKNTANNQEETGDHALVVEGGPSSLMDYRNTDKVITVDDDSSDSSPDSSDSEEEAADNKKAENTEVQINRIMSNQRGASPDREKRVKLNRHGFEDIRTKGELLPEDLPPLEELTITVDESVQMMEVGSIKSIVGILVVIQSNENVPPLDDETILFVTGHKVLGQVFEVFGPVKTPWYSIRFNEKDNIEAKGLSVGMPVYCAPREKSFTKFVFVDNLKSVGGSDASWEDNNEPPEKHLEYSDDEAERRAKAKRRNKKFAETEGEGLEGDEIRGQKKAPRQRNRNKQNRGDQQQTQPSGRAWNPFQGNQNDGASNALPRYGTNQQNYTRNSHPEGQNWPQKQFNRPPSHFGGPPNFQNRPRFGQNDGQQRFSVRNNPGMNNWRPPGNSSYPNNQQNFEFTAQRLGNGPPQSGGPFNIQSPSPSMTPPTVGQNYPRGGVDTSQPPPCFQFGNQTRPPMPPGNWTRQPGSMNQPTGQFSPSSSNQSTENHYMNTQNQSVNTGNQSLNIGTQSMNMRSQSVNIGNQSMNTGNQPMNTGNQSMNSQMRSLGNQMLNQGQSTNFTSCQNSQLNTNTGRPGVASPMGGTNYASPGANFQQSQFNQSSQNSRFGSVPQEVSGNGLNSNVSINQGHGQFQNQANSGGNVSNCSQQNFIQGEANGGQSGQYRGYKNMANGISSAPGFSSSTSGTNSSLTYSAQQAPFGVQGQNHGPFQMQNMSAQNNLNNIQNQQINGHDNRPVSNQNLTGNTQQGFIQQGLPQQPFQQNNVPSFNNLAQVFQGNGAPNHSAGQTGFMPTGTAGQTGFMPTGTAGQTGFMPTGTAGQTGFMPTGVAGNGLVGNNTGHRQSQQTVMDQKFIQNRS